MSSRSSALIDGDAERTAIMPIPAPRYRSAAIRYGETSSRRILDMGELMA